MHILIIPGTFDTRQDWNKVINNLEKYQHRVTYFTYEPPTTDDVVELTDQVQNFLVEKTMLVGSDIGGRICIQLLARKNPYVSGALLLSTPSLAYRSYFSRFLGLVNFFLLPIRLFLPYKLKKIIADKILHLRYRNRKYFLYQKNIQSEQETLLPTIKVFVRLVWGERKCRVPLLVGRRMHSVLKKSDLVVVDSAQEPLNVHSPEIIGNYIHEMTELY